MKSTTFFASALILALALVSIDPIVTTATIPADSTHTKSVRIASLLALALAKPLPQQKPLPPQKRLPQQKENRNIAILADEAQGLDDKCTVAPLSSNPDENWKMEKTFQFTDRGTAYKLVYSWQLPDSTSLCLLDGKTATPVGYQQGWYIDKVVRVRAKLFDVQIHDGNGSNVPAIKYRIDFGQPQKPKVKILRKWTLK
jgi:hypothetical protein